MWNCSVAMIRGRAATRCSNVAVALLVLFAAVASVQAQIYVTNADTGTIGAYNLDGTPINTALITGLEHPQGIAVSGGYIYVATSNPLSDLGGTIGKYTTSGATANANLLSGLASPVHGIAVSGNDLYVIHQSNGGSENTPPPARPSTRRSSRSSKAIPVPSGWRSRGRICSSPTSYRALSVISQPRGRRSMNS
jgi:DNA-binding beta-propeller fold protein YncE